MTSWEYLTIVASREMTMLGYPKEWNRDMQAELARLGKEGWELVSVSPRSTVGGLASAGFTSEEVWVLKRPLKGA